MREEPSLLTTIGVEGGLSRGLVSLKGQILEVVMGLLTGGASSSSKQMASVVRGWIRDK